MILRAILIALLAVQPAFQGIGGKKGGIGGKPGGMGGGASSSAIPAFVQATQNQSGGTTLTLTFPGSVGSNDLIWVGVKLPTTQTITVGPTYNGSTLTIISGVCSDAGVTTDYYGFYLPATVGGAAAVTMTRSSNSGTVFAHAAEFSGVALTSPLDGSQSCNSAGSGATSPLSTGASGSPAGANELAIAIGMDITAGQAMTLTAAGYSTIENVLGLNTASAYAIVSSPTVCTWTFATNGGGYLATVVLFK